ncbi:MAG: patatin-like phospholipase family protein [Pseudomonadota bacterium]
MDVTERDNNHQDPTAGELGDNTDAPGIDNAMSPPVADHDREPSIGLALGGGVARGWCHIGILKALDRHGIKPVVIAGTSVGALVGGFWLAGKLDALEDWALSFSKRRMLSYFDLVVNGPGIIGGNRLYAAMSEYLGDTRIEDLPGRYVAVAAELASGHEAWIREGNLVDAITASYALPGVFPPRSVNGRWLIDGALVNPLPVSVCRAFDARVVLAAGLHADAFGRASTLRREKYENPNLSDTSDLEKAARGGKWNERLIIKRLFRSSGASPGVGSVMLASFNIVMDRITKARLAGDPPDVQILPQAGHIGLLDFDKAEELIALGEEAVDYAAPRIRQAITALA